MQSHEKVVKKQTTPDDEKSCEEAAGNETFEECCTQ
jgi:hypothetical protein